MQLKAVGSTWVTTYDGKYWPVVLCDQETPPKAFMQSRPGGDVFPAILLGRHKYIWVADRFLQEFEPSTNYLGSISPVVDNEQPPNIISPRDNREQERRIAFVQDALQFEGQAFWKNYIESKSEARRLEREMSKRKRPPDDSYSEITSSRSCSSGSVGSSKQQRNGNSLRMGSRWPLTPGPTPAKSSPSGTSESRKSTTDLGNDDIFDDESVVGPPNVKSDPFLDSDDEKEDTEEKLEKIRDKNKQQIKDDPPNDDVCTIFVGETHTPFLVPKDAVGKCVFLTDRVRVNEEVKTHIYLDQDTDIVDSDFMPIWEYMQNGEFAPRLIDGGVYQRLQGVVMPEERDTAAIDIAKPYGTASKIQFGDLQLLIVNKLKALYPLSPSRLLIVIMTTTRTAAWDCEAEDYLREWLIDHVAESFWRLVANEGTTFRRIMDEHEDLRQNVLLKLAQNFDIGRLGLGDD